MPVVSTVRRKAEGFMASMWILSRCADVRTTLVATAARSGAAGAAKQFAEVPQKPAPSAQAPSQAKAWLAMDLDARPQFGRRRLPAFIFILVRPNHGHAVQIRSRT